MGVIPDKKNEQIVFAEQHVPKWAVAPTGVGLTAAMCTAMATAATNARKSHDDALAARLAAKAATVQADNDLAALYQLVTEAVKTIRLYAESTNNPNVYAKAEIPPPAAPVPAQPPTQPVELSAALRPTGALAIQWRCAAASAGLDASTSNVLYTVRRRVGNAGAWTLVGTAKPSRAGKRGFTTFTDDTLPPSPQGLQYLVQGVRSRGSAGGLPGPASDVFSVVLGIGGNGQMVVQSTDTSSSAGIKIAA
jgi:hypothetical protein